MMGAALLILRSSLARVSKDEASWFETPLARLLTTRDDFWSAARSLFP
jgi:hypothetical protein